MNVKYYLLGILFYLDFQIKNCETEKITYLSTERPTVSWYDPKYFRNLSMYSRRFSRRDPRHYVDLYIHALFAMTNNLKAQQQALLKVENERIPKVVSYGEERVDFYFYQFLTNRYRPSFVEMHFRFCDMLAKDFFFGQAMQNALGNMSCPFPPGKYELKNMSVPYVPNGFPFTKGRIYCNASLLEGGVSKLLGYGHIDMEVRTGRI